MRVVGLLGAKGSGKDTMAEHLIDSYAFERIGFADALYKQVAAAYGTTVEALNKRETKETSLSFLSLSKCKDFRFVEVMLQSLIKSTSVRKDCLQYLTTRKMPAHACSRRVKALLNAPRSPRMTLQYWGTEYRRTGKYGVDNYWLDVVARTIGGRPFQRFVITDVRFLNEAHFVEELGGDLIRIRRPVLELREAADRARRGTAAHASEVELLAFNVPYEVTNKEGEPDSLAYGFDLLGLAPTAVAA